VAKTARDHFADRGVVVNSADRLNAIPPIAS
jgi:hypothetical protein